MRIENFAFGAAGAIGAQILLLNAAPVPLALGAAWHFVAFSGLTLVLWIATRGQRPARVTGGVALGAAFVADPLAAAAAALLTGATLYFLQRKPQGKPSCAESSPR